MQLQGKRILVTGGAGFIGSHTVDALIEQGGSVAIIDNLLTGRKENLNPQVRFYEVSVADGQQIAKIFIQEKPEYVYHFAFNIRATMSMEDPLYDMDSIIGTINLLKQAHINQVRKFIFASSGFIYGNTSILPTPETVPLDPVSPYAVAKHTAENYVRFFNKAHGVPYVIFRYATTYGFRQTMSAMADYIRTLKAGQQAEFWGDPASKTRDYIYVDDVVRANLLALKVPNNHPDPIFNVSTNKEISLQVLYEKIAYLLGKKPEPIIHPDRSGEQIRYWLDNSKIKATLPWVPQVMLEEGLQKII